MQASLMAADMWEKCMEDVHSTACHDATAKIEGLEDTIKADCKKKGTFCTATATLSDDSTDEVGECVPTECHGEAVTIGNQLCAADVDTPSCASITTPQCGANT